VERANLSHKACALSLQCRRWIWIVTLPSALVDLADEPLRAATADAPWAYRSDRAAYATLRSADIGLLIRVPGIGRDFHHGAIPLGAVTRALIEPADTEQASRLQGGKLRREPEPVALTVSLPSNLRVSLGAAAVRP